ncbi:MAG: 3,4-dihydroxyphenylacetate 2,3-dioxygenase, partial [Bacillota bacterium]
MVDMRWQRPPFDIVRAAHAELLVSDLEASRHFYVDLLGFVVTEETPGALYLRGYEEQVHHSLVLRQLPASRPDWPGRAWDAERALPASGTDRPAPPLGPDRPLPAAAHLAYRVADEDDLDRLAAFFQSGR